tara:strand:- start:382 stop:1485 length:1104 start_codon:yes stop_codon:yes gene_type:complete
MAYQNVGGSPRFFIDNYQYLRAMGLNPEEYMNDDDALDNISNKTPLDNPNAFTLSPEISKDMSSDDSIHFYIPCGNLLNGMDFSGNMKWYGALLNHNLEDCEAGIQSMLFSNLVGDSYEEIIFDDFSSVLNANPTHLSENGTSIFYSNILPDSDIYRIAGFKLKNQIENEFNLQVGSVSMGVMYTMPKSPDLELTMRILNDGIDKSTTLGGSDLTNIRHTGTPNWANQGKFSSPFGVGDYSEDISLNGARRNGRREWEMKFTHISDSDLFASNYMHNNYLENDSDNYNDSDITTQGEFEYNIFTDDSFIAQVWNKTLGGGLRFMFQPDSNNSNPDQFCIAKFDQKSLEINQIAHKSYEIAVKIREVW